MPRVMLIDDDANIRDLLQLHLSRLGMEVEAYEDAASGIRRVMHSCPDLLVLDLLLPDLGGLEVLQALRGEPATKDLPVVLLTSKRDIDTIARARQLGASAFLTKPVRNENLVETVLRELAKRADPSEN